MKIKKGLMAWVARVGGIVLVLSTLAMGVFGLTRTARVQADSEYLTMAESVGKVFCMRNVGSGNDPVYSGGYDCDRDGVKDDMRFLITDTPGPDGQTALVMAMDVWEKSSWSSSDIPSTINPDNIMSALEDFSDAVPANVSSLFPTQTWAWNNIPDYDTSTETDTGVTSTQKAAAVSFTEWVGTGGTARSSVLAGSVGDWFCRALSGSSLCPYTNLIKSTYGTAAIWTRTASDYMGSYSAWSTRDFDNELPLWATGTSDPASIVLPVLAATDSLEFCDAGAGTYIQPYFIAPDCPTTPTVTITSPTEPNPWFGSNVIITGDIADSIFGNFTVYSWISDSTSRPAEDEWILRADNAPSYSLSAWPDLGQNYVHYKITNGYTEPAYGYTAVRVDYAYPEITVTPSYDPIYSDPVSPVVTATDTGIGIKRLCYAWDIDIYDCDDSNAIAFTSGDQLPTGPQDYGKTSYLYVVGEDLLDNTSWDEFEYKIAKRPPVIASVTPSSGPTTGGTTLTITGDYFGVKPLDSDEYVIQSILRSDNTYQTDCVIYQLTNKSQILATDCDGTTTLVDTSIVTGTILKLGDSRLEYPYDLLYFITDESELYFIRIYDDGTTSTFKLPLNLANEGVFVTDVSFSGGHSWDDTGGGIMPILSNGDYALLTMSYDDVADEFLFGGSSSSSAKCPPIALAGQFALCYDRTTIEDTTTGDLLHMPGSVTIASITLAPQYANSNIVVQIIGSDNQIYFATADLVAGAPSELISADDYFGVTSDPATVKGTLMSLECFWDGICIALDDLGNIYGIDTYEELIDISDYYNYADIKSSLSTISFNPILYQFIVTTTTGDYYRLPDNGSAPVLLSGNLENPTISVGGFDCAITSWTDTSATCTTSAHTSGAVDVTLTNSAGTATKQNAFTYTGDDPVFIKTLTDPATGIIVESLSIMGFTDDLYLSINKVDPATRDLGVYAAFANLGIYDIEVCSTLDQSCRPIHTWSKGLRIKIPLTDTSYDRYHVLYLPNADLANLIDSSIEGGYAIFDTEHLSEYAIVATNSPQAPNAGFGFLGLDGGSAEGLVASTLGGAVVAGAVLFVGRKKIFR